MRLEKTTQIVARTEHNTLVLEYRNGRRKEVDPDRPGLFRWITGQQPRPWRITRKYRGEMWKVNLDVHDPMAAKRLYTEFELDPERLVGDLKAVNARKASPLMNDAARAWLRFCEHKGNTDALVRRKQVALERLSSFAENCRVSRIQDEVIEGFVRWLETKERLHPNTVRHDVQAIYKPFWSFVQKQGWTRYQHDPWADVKLPKAVATKEICKRMVTKEEVLRIMPHLREWEKRTVAVLWALALNPLDLFSLKVTQIGTRDMVVRFLRAKTGTAVTVPIPDDYILECLVWVMKFAEGRKKRALIAALHRSVKQACAKEKMDPFALLALRHSRISLWLEEGCTILDVAKWVGHKDIRQTAEYVVFNQTIARRPGETGLGPKVDNQGAGSADDLPAWLH